MNEEVAFFCDGFRAFCAKLVADFDELVLVEVLELACEDYDVFGKWPSSGLFWRCLRLFGLFLLLLTLALHFALLQIFHLPFLAGFCLRLSKLYRWFAIFLISIIIQNLVLLNRTSSETQLYGFFDLFCLIIQVAIVQLIGRHAFGLQLSLIDFL